MYARFYHQRKNYEERRISRKKKFIGFVGKVIRIFDYKKIKIFLI